MNNQPTKRQKELKEAAKPLIKYLNDIHDPHTKVIVDCDSAEVVSGQLCIRTTEFIQD